MVSGTRGKSAPLCTGDYKRAGIRELNEPKTRARPVHVHDYRRFFATR